MLETPDTRCINSGSLLSILKEAISVVSPVTGLALGGTSLVVSTAAKAVVQSLYPFTPQLKEHILPVYSIKEVAKHYDSESCWIVISGKVYDVTEFLHLHPAGCEIILEHGGHDATTSFTEVGHSAEALAMLEKYCIGLCEGN